MRNDYRGNRSGGGGYNRGGGGGGGRGGDRPMFQATCDNCGDSCMVPFRPSGDKPVYCSNCFEKNNRNEGDYGKRDGGSSRYERRDSGRRDMFPAVCDNCGKNCEVPFRPSSDKPIYCSDCFGEKREQGGNDRGNDRRDGRQTGGGSSNNAQLEKKIAQIDAKLDQILRLLKPTSMSESVSIDDVVETSLFESPKVKSKKATVAEVVTKPKKKAAKKTVKKSKAE